MSGTGVTAPGVRQAGAEGEFHRLGADDGPARVVVEKRSVGLLGAGGGLRETPGMEKKLRPWRPQTHPAPGAVPGLP